MINTQRTFPNGAPRPAERCEIVANDPDDAQFQPHFPSADQLPTDARRFVGIEAVRTSQGPLPLDIYLPAEADGPLPLIIWVHGGGFHSDEQSRYAFLPGRVVGRGYALATIEYRSSEIAKFPAQIQDCKAGVRWLRAHAKDYGIDPNRMGAWGISAGGTLAALLATTDDVKEFEGSDAPTDVSSRLQAVCVFCGVTDFLDLRPSKVPTCAQEGQMEIARSAVRTLLGGEPAKLHDLAVSASAVNHGGPDCPPILLMHGDTDLMVPLEQGDKFYESLRSRGAEVKYCVARGGRHLIMGPEVDRTVDEFFDKNLR